MDTGSHYYTISYTPTNNNWDGRYRRLKVETVREGLRLEYRKGYYARVNERARQQHLAASAAGEDAASSAAMQAAMEMGAVTATQIVFAAKVTPSEQVTKDTANAPAAKGNYLNEKLRRKGYRNYAIRFSIDANDLQLMPTPDLTSYHGRIQLVAVLYDSQGQKMNSDMGELPLDIDKASYDQIERSGLATGMTIAVPAKGDYFLRLGVRDMKTGRIGAVEIPMDRVKMGS